MNQIYKTEDVQEFYPDIVEAYVDAFAGDPWYEVSKCVARETQEERCAGGLSKLAVGSFCEFCQARTEKPAYEYKDLVDRFEEVGQTRPTRWYLEFNEQGLTLVALAWQALPERIAIEKYADVPAMNRWLPDNIKQSLYNNEEDPEEPIIWLDEVFANKSLKARGNLWNFGTMCVGLATELGSNLLAFRTINPRMNSAVERSFGDQAKVFKSKKQDLPDRRDLILIDTTI